MNSIYFTTAKEIDEHKLLQAIHVVSPVKKIEWLDLNTTADATNKEILFGAKKTGNGQFKYRYELFFREHIGILSLRGKIDWLKQAVTLLQTDLLTPDEEIDPYTYILVDAEKAYPVEINPDLYNENDEITISGAYHGSLGGFATERILTHTEEKALVEELNKSNLLCELIQYEPGLLPHDFNLCKKNFEPLQQYNHLYLITQAGTTEWLSKDEKSKQLLDLMTLFYNRAKVNVCIFPPNSVTIENIPGGSDSEAFCICVDTNGVQKIVYKARKTKWSVY